MTLELDASVIIPTRNRPVHLREALASVLGSIGDRIEVIVVDDDGDQPARDSLPPEVVSDPRLVILRRSGPHGAAAARNLGCSHARGKVLFFLDDDDVMLPGYCHLVLAEIAGRDLPWGFSPILRHGDQGPAPWAIPDRLTLTELPKPLGREHLTGLGCGFWVQKSLFVQSGGLDPDFRVNEDTEFCLRLLSLGHQPWICDKPGVSVLKHGPTNGGEQPSVTRETRASQRATFFARILERYRAFLQTAPRIERFLVQRYLKTLAKTGPVRSGLHAARAYGVSGAVRYFLLNWLMYRVTLHPTGDAG